MAVFVLDKRKQPLMPCSEKRARLLLDRGRAVVHRAVPFTIRLRDRRVEDSAIQPVRLALDPGSKVTGLAVVRETKQADLKTGEVRRERAVLTLFELSHRGEAIRKSLDQRRVFRRARRNRKTRYRAPRFNNRRRPKGWLPPSLRHRLETARTWVHRFQRLAPVVAVSQELVRFDTQAMENPEISGVEYQQGTLYGYEVREYLLEKWGRKCVYCSAKGRPLEIEHIIPRSRGGTDRVSNLTVACRSCNQAKGNRDVRDFLKSQRKRLMRILSHAKSSLKDAAAVNSTRWALFNVLAETGLNMEAGTGGRTKWNRTRLGIPKTHTLDAVCVGRVDFVSGWQCPVLSIRATGRGSYQRTRLTRHGFPRGYLMRHKRVRGFQTGDYVRAEVPTGKWSGIHVGRVAVRSSGRFNIQKPQGVVQGIHARYCTLIQRADGYGYAVQSKKTVGEKEVASEAA
ncbi:MAG: hypothetical protein NPIRA04_30860 [Nitrospirales bacterium]|nr:MAG: hypothetical protein NPIRA04_30860 [Nitrospirales bacterium]